MACCEVLFGTVPPKASPTEAQIPIYIDRTSKKVYYWNGTGWELIWEIQTAGNGTPGAVAIDPNSPINFGPGGTLQINCERLKTQCGFATAQEVSEAVTSAINELVKSLNTSMQNFDSRITTLNSKVSKVETDLGSLTGRVSSIEAWDLCAKTSSCGRSTVGCSAAGLVQDSTNGIADVTMTSADLTLTALQYCKPIIVLSGALTANLNLIFPAIAGEWTVVNNCTGSYTVTCKTAAGTGAVVTPGRTRIIWGDGTNIAGAVNEVETPEQFDATTKIATMAAVQRALGNLRSETAVNSSTTLDASAIGQLIVGDAGTYTTTMPLANSVPPGSCIWFEGTSGIVTWLVQRQGTDIIDNNGGGTFFSLGTGGTAILESNGVGTWRIIGGSAALRNAADFGASTASAGYQKLPSGLIIQWGSGIYGTATAVSFPIAFPNICRQVIIGAGSYDGTQAAFQKVLAIAAYYQTTSGFTASSSTGNGSSAAWVAIGF